jgi:hypothetical protein
MLGGPKICNVKNSDTLLLDFFNFGFGYEQPIGTGYGKVHHSQLPPNAKEALTLIQKNITKLGIQIDAFFLQSNLWDVTRHQQFFPNSSWPEYQKGWTANATEMIQLVEQLFPTSKHMWVSTRVRRGDTRQPHSQSLNQAAQAILPKSWIYVDVEKILRKNFHYRDTFHLAAQSTIPLMKHLLEVHAGANLCYDCPAVQR